MGFLKKLVCVFAVIGVYQTYAWCSLAWTKVIGSGSGSGSQKKK